jgi:chemotaxis protein histidine kinase CheA
VVRVERDAGLFNLSVHDDGMGFDAEAARQRALESEAWASSAWRSGPSLPGGD